MVRRIDANNVRRKMGDRRIRPRFDIVGDLWGSLESVLRLPLKNVSRGGALIHSHVPLPLQSVHRLALHADDQELSIPVRVSHVDPRTSADGERTYFIGVEFVSIQPVLTQLVDRLLIAGRGEAAGV